jgi:crotonobetainyl-CoA hydratase
MTSVTDAGSAPEPVARPVRDPVRLDRAGWTLVITIDRPEVRNCVNLAVHEAIGAALEDAEADPTIRSIVLTGAGDRAFCAGADLKAVARGETLLPDDPVSRSWGFAGYVFHHIGTPTIAAVNGAALGGGTELVLASDLAVASTTATFGLPEVKRGLIASEGGAMRLPQQIPHKRAMELILTGDPVGAEEAYALGLVNRVVPPDRVLDEALALAERINVNAPLSVSASKRIARGIVDGEVAREREQRELTLRLQAELRASADYREGLDAFAEGRAPRWQGR